MAMIDCVEKDENGDSPLIKLHFDDNDNEKIKHWILQANPKLTSLDFMNGCGKADCYWCKFAKTTEQVVYLPENEDGDDSSAGD